MDRDRFGEGREIAEWIESQGESVVLRVGRLCFKVEQKRNVKFETG